MQSNIWAEQSGSGGIGGMGAGVGAPKREAVGL